MRNFDQAVERMRRQWDSTTAQEVIRDLVTAIWQAGGPDDRTRGWAAAIRQTLQAQSEAVSSPAEQLALLNLSYTLEQGVGNRGEALELARRAEALCRRAGTPMDRVRAVFQLAKALLYVDRNADAVRWTNQGLQLGGQLEEAVAGGTGPALGDAELTELRRLLADQQSRQVNRMATLGGMDGEVDRAAEATVARWEKLDDPAGMAAGLGMLVEARVFQGRWEDAARLARRALAAVGYPKKDPGIAYALCFGALALCRLGDPQTALTWTTDAANISRQVGNHECVLEAGAVHAVALAAVGRVAEALAEVDRVIGETHALNMGVLTRWTTSLRAWIRMKARLPTPPEELQEACDYLTERGYPLVAAEVLYAASCALRLAGRDDRKERDEAIAQFERLHMSWHLETARRGALIV
jgi:tetratricopeptide (TPR) repeat protein